MYKVGDRVNWKCNNYKNLWQNCEVIEVYDLHVTVLNSAGSRGSLWKQDIELVKEEKTMTTFEVGKEYLLNRNNNRRIEVLFKTEKGVLVEYKAVENPVDGVVYVGSHNFFPFLTSNHWEEYVEPKVVTKDFKISHRDGYINAHTGFTNDSLVGKIRITYTEGSGIAVEILEGGDTGTI